MKSFNVNFTENREQIINLWSTVFGDTKEDILFFLNNCKNYKCLGLSLENQLVSMLFLVDCSLGDYKGSYIYAVATLPEFRGRGFASALVNRAKEYMKDFLWLIPASEGLPDYYGRLGFKTKLYSFSDYSDKILFYETDEITEYLYEGCELEKPIGMVYSEFDFPNADTGYKNIGE